MRRSLRHPIRGDRRYPKPPARRARQPTWRSVARQPRIRPRKSVNVSSLVGTPEDEPSRPSLRLRVVGISVLVLFGILILRLWTLQVIDGKTYAAAVTRNQVRVVSVAAPRGEIVDRNDTVLVGNQPDQEILLSRLEALDHPSIIGKVAALVGQTPQQVNASVGNQRYSPYEPVPVAENVQPATVQTLELHPSEYPGVSVQTVTQRTYPQGGTTATHILGYLGDITSAFLKANPKAGYTQGSLVGQSGIEAQYEADLRGVDGRQALSVNASGNVVGTLSRTAPQLGDTVVLNIDTGLQQAVEADLANQIKVDRNTPDVEDHGQKPPAPNGAVIVMNPQNGQVYAMASFPTYDNNEWVGGISTANFNAVETSGALNDNAIAGLYTPGSTFKLITATAALQAGLISPNTYYKDTGKFVVTPCNGAAAGCTFGDNPGDPTGDYNVSSALTVSSDAFFYNIGNMFWNARSTYGSTPIQNTAAQYGEGVISGIDLPNEAQGRVDSQPERQKLHDNPHTEALSPSTTWFTGDNIEMAFGQGATFLTPIEQAVSYATFANGGTRYAPQVAGQIVNPTTGKVVKTMAPQVTGKVTISPANYQAILQGLEGVIYNKNGTGYQAFTGFPSNFILAGKTGTASNQLGQEPNSWFVAFGPQPTPTYLVLAVIGQGGYGAEAAAPLVRSIFDYLLANPISGPVKTPTVANPPSSTLPKSNPPLGTPTTTTTAPSSSTTTTTKPGTATTTPTAPTTTTTTVPAPTTTTTLQPGG
ncbi:MAG TPA: penicillin-binding protein 2 [Acidimicrobiales bacterium]|nr:penicillin-binding protein 2 [Acidimicrobiales bacterium]